MLSLNKKCKLQRQLELCKGENNVNLEIVIFNLLVSSGKQRSVYLDLETITSSRKHITETCRYSFIPKQHTWQNVKLTFPYRWVASLVVAAQLSVSSRALSKAPVIESILDHSLTSWSRKGEDPVEGGGAATTSIVSSKIVVCYNSRMCSDLVLGCY